MSLMKHNLIQHLRIVIVLCNFLLIGLTFKANGLVHYNLKLTLTGYEVTNNYEEVGNNRGHRLPGQYVWEGTLDKKGYTNIPDDILQYEIWNEKNDVRLAIFSDEREFIECLLNLQGEYYIHLITPDIHYIGTITIEY